MEDELYTMISEYFKDIAENVEEYVNDFIKIYKQSDKTSTSERKINDVKTRIDKEKNKRDKLFDLYVDGSMEKKEFTERNDVINSVIKELEEEYTKKRRRRFGAGGEGKRTLTFFN